MVQHGYKRTVIISYISRPSRNIRPTIHFESEYTMAKYSKKAQQAIAHKMSVMKGENRPQKQKVAIAMSEAREKGLKVPGELKDPAKKIGNPYGLHDLPDSSTEKQGQGMQIKPGSQEPLHHLPKELRHKAHEFLKHPQIKVASPKKY